MVNETMTLDELQKWLSDKSSDEKENYSSHKFAYNTVWHFIEDNRTALEASMKETLRFRIHNPANQIGRLIVDLLDKEGEVIKWDEDELSGWIDVADQRTPQGRKSGRKLAEDFAWKFAQSLGITAEFVEEKSDGS